MIFRSEIIDTTICWRALSSTNQRAIPEVCQNAVVDDDLVSISLIMRFNASKVRIQMKHRRFSRTIASIDFLNLWKHWDTGMFNFWTVKQQKWKFSSVKFTFDSEGLTKRWLHTHLLSLHDPTTFVLPAGTRVTVGVEPSNAGAPRKRSTKYSLDMFRNYQSLQAFEWNKNISKIYCWQKNPKFKSSTLITSSKENSA